jgi:PAS domain S-box-containing protein
VSSSERLSERRRSSAAHVRTILDNTLDAVIALDAEGRVTFWNPQAEQTFALPREKALGRELAELILPGEGRESLRQALVLVSREQERTADHRLEVEAQGSGGHRFPLELTITAIPDGGEFTFSAFARDITRRKHDDRERERLLQEAERARTQAEAASRVKDEFLSTLSHELRTPLTAIVGWTYLLRGGRLDETTAARGLEAIERNAAAQAQVISDILDLSRIVGAKFRLNVRPLQLASIAAAAIEPLIPAANAKGIKVQAVLDPNAGLVAGDPDRLRQVIWNLFSNAVKFTPRGGRATVRVERAGDHVRMVVEDTGEGIPPEFLPHVFERFRQGDSSNTRSHGGLGLGLAVVHHLVELHGGTVDVRSAGEGQGARFTVTLPILDPSRLPPAAPAPAPLASDATALVPEAPDLTDIRVLIVDDGEDVREMVTAVLGQCGATVRAVATAGEALRALAELAPHVLVIELELHGETGFSLIQKVRALPAERGGQVPAAALSVYGRTDDRVQALLAGFQIHLLKPVQPAELIAVVASLAARSGGGRRH